MNLRYICKQKQDHFNSSPALRGDFWRGVLAAPNSELLIATHAGGGAEGSPGDAPFSHPSSPPSLVPCRMTEEIRKLFSTLGSAHAEQLGFRDSWVFLGAQNLQSKSPFEQVSSWRPPGPSEGGMRGAGDDARDGQTMAGVAWEGNTGQCEESHPAVVHPRGQGGPTGSFSSRKQPRPLCREVGPV